MTFLHIVDRELRVTARRPKTYWLRLAAALAAAAISLWICLWASRGQPPTTMGRSLFSALTVLAFTYCLVIGPFITADCISEEKRQGTLGLLFLTDLSSWDVVLGKWLATSLAAFYGLLAFLPALGLPLLLGGVTPAEYGRIALGIVNAILFSLTVGMFISALSREQAKATLASVIVILGLSGLVPGLATFVATDFFQKPLAKLPSVILASPAYTGYLALDAAYRAAPRHFWISLGLVHGLTWLFMIATAVLVPRVWREHPEEKPATCRWFWRFGYFGGWRRAFKRRLERNPVFALAARLRWPHLVFWSVVLLVGMNVFWLTYGYRRSPSSYQFHQYFGYALIFINRVWVTTMACRFILELRRTGALELLLTSPVPCRTILRGHWQALRHFFVWPVAAIAMLHVFYVFGSLPPAGTTLTDSLRWLQASALSATGSMVSFLADVFALCWMGTWLSLSCRKTNLAILITLVLVIVIPWTALHFIRDVRLPWIANPLLQSYLSRPLCMIGKDLLFVLWAWYRLRHHFRAAAAQTYRHTPPARRWWWPFGNRPQRMPAALAVAPDA